MKEGDLQLGNEFKTDSRNPLTEMSELRLEIIEVDGAFDINCRLRFGKMNFEHEKREYEVGVMLAALRLSLEGCETTLGDSYGENVFEPVVEENEYESTTALGSQVGASIENLEKGGLTIGGEARVTGTMKQKLSHKKTYLPVSARPNESWEIGSKSAAKDESSSLEGTAIPGERLCRVRRKKGGNRLEIIGEVQVSKRSLRVSRKGGNKLSRALSEFQNKDAIVSQILKKAIQREAASQSSNHNSPVVVVSRGEISEE
ncbi:hypothetical protein DXV76_12850 [Rhodobacteraceae bacterium CCMM004]|nr:hypothetical protein DXV76_12850 [Rhodobacteraceae bacterium CCMM004]